MSKISSTQRFPLPTLPFDREISHPGVGTEVLIRGTPYAHQNSRSFTVSIEADHSTALLLDCRLGNPAEVAATANVDGKITSEVKKPCSFQPQASFRLMICAKEHIFEVFLNDVFLLDFVHRVNPLDFKKLKVEGSLYVEEIVITPGRMPSSMNDPLPPPPEYVNVPRVSSNAPTAPKAPSVSSIPNVPNPSNTVDHLALGLLGINLQNAQHATQNQRLNNARQQQQQSQQRLSNVPQPSFLPQQTPQYQPQLQQTSKVVPNAPPDAWEEKRKLVNEAIKASLTQTRHPVPQTVNPLTQAASSSRPPYPATNPPAPPLLTTVQPLRTPYPNQVNQPMPQPVPQPMPQPIPPLAQQIPQAPIQQPFTATMPMPAQAYQPAIAQATPPPPGQFIQTVPAQGYPPYPAQPPPIHPNSFYATQIPQPYPGYYPVQYGYGVYDMPTMVTHGAGFVHYAHCYDHCHDSC